MKYCKHCSIELNEINRSGPRLSCKPCRSKEVIKYEARDIEKRRARMRNWTRKSGKVKEYPCETCQKLCFKKYVRAFCSDECRFMAYVDVTKNCWIWIGAKNRRGYGKLCFKTSKNDTAHRVSYKLFKGPIIDNKFVCHTCDNPSCVKPSHLWLGTTQLNKKDQIDKDRGGRKLKASDILQIRNLYENNIGSNTIAKQYNVNCSTITNIVKRRTWKHI